MGRMLAVLAIALTTIGLLQAGQGQPTPKKPDVIRQLRDDFEEARARLQKDDSGQATRAAHRRIIEGIDKLLEEENPDNNPPAPPPPGAPPMPPPTDSSATPKQNPSAPKAPEQAKATPQPKSAPGTESTPQSRPGVDGKALPMRPEMDGPWHPLRKLPREAVDAIGRERFPRGYEELLRAYYRSLAASRSEE
ncbi:MAG TPA: hypothetical protein VFE62_27285 [Gemmataceae bacterium]|nr:hypothetical protein [Gemmataceae bacterium]